MTTKADYERRIKRAITWLEACGPNLSAEKSSAFQDKYQELTDEAEAAYPDIQYPLLEFGQGNILKVYRRRS